MRRVVVAVCILLVVGVGVTLWVRARTRAEGNAADVETVAVKRGVVTLSVSADGVLQPLTTVTVKSYAGGRVDVLAVDVGDQVKPGDLIAKIDPTDSLTAYDQARADLAAAHARLTQANEQAQAQPTLTRAAIAQAEAAYNTAIKDQQRLEQATQPQARAAARAALDKAQANLALAEKDLTRVQGLKAQGFVAQSEVDVTINQRDLAKAELASAQERWNTLQQEQAAELEAAKAKTAQAKAAVDRANADTVQDRLKKADVASATAQVQRAQAQVDNAKTMLDYTTIRAPRAGVILDKYVEQGTIITSGRSSVSQGTDIVLIGDLTKMFADVSLDEADVASVRLGQRVNIRLDAFPDESFQGHVTRINPEAVTEQNITTVLVTVQIANPDARLKPGMTASCDFLVERVTGTLYLPSRAIREVAGERMATVLEDGQVVDVPVQVGLVGDERTEILEGLKEGAKVVVPGLLSPSDERAARMRERGRRMGGAGGFVR